MVLSPMVNTGGLSKMQALNSGYPMFYTYHLQQTLQLCMEYPQQNRGMVSTTRENDRICFLNSCFRFGFELGVVCFLCLDSVDFFVNIFSLVWNRDNNDTLFRQFYNHLMPFPVLLSGIIRHHAPSPLL